MDYGYYGAEGGHHIDERFTDNRESSYVMPFLGALMTSAFHMNELVLALHPAPYKSINTICCRIIKEIYTDYTPLERFVN